MNPVLSPKPDVGEIPARADVVLRAAAIYSMREDRTVYRSIALRDEWIVAASGDPHGLDSLAGDGARLVDLPNLTLLPVFDDSHNHLIQVAEGIRRVQPDEAHNLAELLELIRQRAAQTPPGAWIQTATAWDESNLAEKRLPTAAELDGAAPANPVWAQRGGHIGVANSLALKLAGITRDTPDPQLGKILRGADGAPTGVLVAGPAMGLVSHLIPPDTFEQRVADLGQACQHYNSLGLGAVRDPIVTRDQVLVYQALKERGELTLRCQLMYLIPQGSVQERITDFESLGVRSGFGDDWLKIWGLKSLMDGGPTSAALEAPYTDRPDVTGTPYWQTDELVAVLDAAVGRGWRVGIHAIGDRAVRLVVDAYEQVTLRHPGLRPGTLVVEHAFLAGPEQRARAVRLGVGITVQHPLLYAQGAALLQGWGEERVRQIMPVRAWVEAGALVAAGSDAPEPYDPMLSVWGLVTRGTRQVGVQGPDQAVDRYTAIQLYTLGSARLYWEEERRGTVQPGKLADLVGYPADPLTCPVDDLPALHPAFTMVGGRAVYDPGGVF